MSWAISPFLQQQGRLEVKLLDFRSIFKANKGDVKAILPLAEQLVQLVMFAW